MKVFLSWAGTRSKVIAEALYDWLPRVIQTVKPWMSGMDIEKGRRWGDELAQELESANFGVVCLTPENLSEPWIHFEAGALSKNVEESYLWTYLYDLGPAQVREPLAQFQHTKATEEDTQKLSLTINRAQGDSMIPPHIVEDQFKMLWPKLQEELEGVASMETGEPVSQRRESDDILDETLLLVRSISNQSEALIRLFATVYPDFGRDNVTRKILNQPKLLALRDLIISSGVTPSSVKAATEKSKSEETD